VIFAELADEDVQKITRLSGDPGRLRGSRLVTAPASLFGASSTFAPHSNIPSTGGWPAAGTLSITASWSDPATHQQPAPATVGTPIAARRSTIGAATGPCLVRNTTRRSPTSGQAAGSIAHDVHAIAAEETAVEPNNHRARLRNTPGYRSYSARVGVGRSQSNGMASRRRLAPSPSVTKQVTPPRG